MLFKTLWKMILGRTKLALVRAGALPRCHWQHGGEGNTWNSRAGTRPAWPRHRVPVIVRRQQTFFALQPPQCKPGAGWGLVLPSSLPLWLLVPGAGVPGGFSSAPSVSHHQLRAVLPDPSFSVPLLDMEEFHDAKLNQEKPVRGVKQVPGEAFLHGAWPGCSGCTKKLLSL